MPESQLQLWQAQKISSVLRRGSLSGSKLYENGELDLPSCEPGALASVYGRIIFPPSLIGEDAFLYDLQRVLYASPDHVFPSVTERQGEPLYWSMHNNSLSSRIIKQLERRIASCFVILDRNTASKSHTREHVSPQDFDTVLFPGQLWKKHARLVESLKQLGTEIVIVDDFIKREFPGFGKALSIPNFEAPIAQQVKEDDRPAWVSAVRLPTPQDLFRSRKDPGYRFPKLEHTQYTPGWLHL